jgi:hypothetical protein
MTYRWITTKIATVLEVEPAALFRVPSTPRSYWGLDAGLGLRVIRPDGIQQWQEPTKNGLERICG